MDGSFDRPTERTRSSRKEMPFLSMPMNTKNDNNNKGVTRKKSTSTNSSKSSSSRKSPAKRPPAKVVPIEQAMDRKKPAKSASEAEQQQPVPRRKPGLKTASIMDNTTARPEEIAQAVRNSFQYFNRQIVKSDEECAERINGYFQDCAEQQMLPTVENLSLALGTVRRTVWDWEQGIGCSQTRTNMIKKAKQILAAIDAELVSSGKIPQVVYIFRAKNFHGMTDQQEITVTAQNGQDQDRSVEDIKKWLEDGKTVETGFTDEGQ